MRKNPGPGVDRAFGMDDQSVLEYDERGPSMSTASAAYSQAIERIRDAIERASATGRRNMNAMSLATVDASGAPSVRHVLLKGIDEQGLRFFTDARSEKARNLAENPKASVCFYWEPIEEQARVDGTVVRLSDEEVAADFAARPRAGQVMITVCLLYTSPSPRD